MLLNNILIMLYHVMVISKEPSSPCKCQVIAALDLIRKSTPTPLYWIRIRLRNKYDSGYSNRIWYDNVTHVLFDFAWKTWKTLPERTRVFRAKLTKKSIWRRLVKQNSSQTPSSQKHWKNYKIAGTDEQNDFTFFKI